jgi:predicted metal-dependent hydrolase
VSEQPASGEVPGVAAEAAASGGSATIRENGREKAYRPLPEADRRAAFASALEAYERGDFFLAHELLEPAWMGASDPAERALHSGLIKVAAGFVHQVRGNPAGVVKNFRGARLRLRAGLAAGPAFGLDAPAILAQLEASLEAVDRGLAATPVRITPSEVSAAR